MHDVPSRASPFLPTYHSRCAARYRTAPNLVRLPAPAAFSCWKALSAWYVARDGKEAEGHEEAKADQAQAGPRVRERRKVADAGSGTREGPCRGTSGLSARPSIRVRGEKAIRRSPVHFRSRSRDGGRGRPGGIGCRDGCRPGPCTTGASPAPTSEGRDGRMVFRSARRGQRLFHLRRFPGETGPGSLGSATGGAGGRGSRGVRCIRPTQRLRYPHGQGHSAAISWRPSCGSSGDRFGTGWT